MMDLDSPVDAKGIPQPPQKSSWGQSVPAGNK